MTAETRTTQVNELTKMHRARKQVDVENEWKDEASPIAATNHQTLAETTSATKSLRAVEHIPTFYTLYLKPAGDRVAALCAMSILVIPMLSTAFILAISMGRPILFRQRRVGLNGTVFNILKFRTMGHDRRTEDFSVDPEHRVTHKSDQDPRHTDVGRFIRRYSLDELPQLINVLYGDMSIVGPRPELESVVKGNYPEQLKQRHLVRPGLTGLWQISARGSGPMHENGEWDLEYIEKISLLTDIKIVLKTPFAMFGSNRGA